MESILLLIAFLGMLIGSFTDIKAREVPDWVNYSMIFIGLGLRLLFSAAFWDYHFILEGVIGFALFAGLAFLMFYAGQWGGGDAKMMMGLGALIGFNLKLDHFFLGFLVNLAVVGGIYGLLWSISLSIIKWKDFSREFKKVFLAKPAVIIRRISLAISALLLIPIFIIQGFWIKVAFFIVLFMASTTPCLWAFVKSVENSSMFKLVNPEQLTEGDWIVDEIRVKGSYIAGPKDLGIEVHQIKKLIELKKQNKVDKILIKEGIPFVPSFLLGFITTLIWGNLFLLLL